MPMLTSSPSPSFPVNPVSNEMTVETTKMGRAVHEQANKIQRLEETVRGKQGRAKQLATRERHGAQEHGKVQGESEELKAQINCLTQECDEMAPRLHSLEEQDKLAQRLREMGEGAVMRQLVLKLNELERNEAPRQRQIEALSKTVAGLTEDVQKKDSVLRVFQIRARSGGLEPD